MATLAALVTLLPGMTLTIGMRELATDHLQSGFSNAAIALVQLLGLGFGVAIGRSIAPAGSAPRSPVPTLRSGIERMAAAVAGVAFTVTLSAQRRDA